MPRSRSQKRQRKHRRTHGGDASTHVASVVGDYPNHAAQAGSNVIAQHPAGQQGGALLALSPVELSSAGTIMPVAAGAAQPVAITTPGAAPSSVTGGSRRRRSNKRRGGTVLGDVALPAVLLYANHVVGKKSRGNKSYSKKRFSRRNPLSVVV
jgi:hypothetical protein